MPRPFIGPNMWPNTHIEALRRWKAVQMGWMCYGHGRVFHVPPPKGSRIQWSQENNPKVWTKTNDLVFSIWSKKKPDSDGKFHRQIVCLGPWEGPWSSFNMGRKPVKFKLDTCLSIWISSRPGSSMINNVLNAYWKWEASWFQSRWHNPFIYGPP